MARDQTESTFTFMLIKSAVYVGISPSGFYAGASIQSEPSELTRSIITCTASLDQSLEPRGLYTAVGVDSVSKAFLGIDQVKIFPHVHKHRHTKKKSALGLEIVTLQPFLGHETALGKAPCNVMRNEA